MFQLANPNVSIAVSQTRKVEKPRKRHQQPRASTEFIETLVHRTMLVSVEQCGTRDTSRSAAVLLRRTKQVTQRLHRREHHVMEHPSHAVVQRVERLHPNRHVPFRSRKESQVVYEDPRRLPLVVAAAVEEHHGIHQELEGVAEGEVSLGVEGGLDVGPAGDEVDGVELARGVEPES